MKEKVNLHIYAKACKSNKFGHLPIYIRLTVAGQRFEFSTKKFDNPVQWSAEKSRIKGSSEEACTINNYLEVLKNQIFDIELELVHQKLPITIEAFKSKLAGTKSRARTLIPIFLDHNNRIKEPLCEVSGFRKLYSKLS